MSAGQLNAANLNPEAECRLTRIVNQPTRRDVNRDGELPPLMVCARDPVREVDFVGPKGR